MHRVVIFTEEESMEKLLNAILPDLLPEVEPHNLPRVIPHNGKSDLMSRLENRLQGWNEPDVHFLVIHDQDKCDCRQIKADIKNVADKTNKADRVKIRIACQELESWYFGDLPAVERAYSKPVSKHANKSSYRIPDAIDSPKKALQKLVPYQPVAGTKLIAKYMNLTNNRSDSFNAFRLCIRKMHDLT